MASPNVRGLGALGRHFIFFLLLSCVCYASLPCEFLRGVDFEYNVLSEVAAASVDECCQICTGAAECVAFSYYYNSNTCTLRHTESAQVNRRGVMSGRRAAPSPPPPLPGAVPIDIRILEHSAITIYLFGSDIPLNAYTSQILSLPSVGRLFDVSGSNGIGSQITSVPYTLTDPKHRVLYVLHTSNGKDTFEFAILEGDHVKESAIVSVTPVQVQPADYDCHKLRDTNVTRTVPVAELRTVSITHENVSFAFSRRFSNPVVFAQPLSWNERNGAAVPRVTDVSQSGFSVQIQEAPSSDGVHEAEELTYLVIEAGSWRLPDGTRIEVGSVVTDATVGLSETQNTWQSVSFPSQTLFEDPPVVLTQVQTDNDPHWVKTRQKSVTTSSFAVSLEEEQSNEVSHGGEIVGWLAMEPAVSGWDGHLYEMGVELDVYSRPRDWWHLIRFRQTFTHTPFFLAVMTTFDDSDPAHLRYRSLNEQGVSVRIEEDQEQDIERSHGSEKVAFFALEAPDRSVPLQLSAIPVDCYSVPTALDLAVVSEPGHATVVILKPTNDDIYPVVTSLPTKGSLYQYQPDEGSEGYYNVSIDEVGTIVNDTQGRVLYVPGIDTPFTEDRFSYYLQDNANHKSNIATVIVRPLPVYIPKKIEVSRTVSNPVIIAVGLFGFVLAAALISFCIVFFVKRPTARQELEGFMTLGGVVTDNDGTTTYFKENEGAPNENSLDISQDSLEEDEE